jgi:phosphatidylglycerophosphate synthase
MYSKNKALLDKLSVYLLYFSYIPVTLMTLPFFIAANILLMPVAYLYSLAHKFNIFMIDRRRSKRKLIFRFLIFLLFGPVLLLMTQFTDTYYFLKHLYTKENEKK